MNQEQAEAAGWIFYEGGAERRVPGGPGTSSALIKFSGSPTMTRLLASIESWENESRRRRKGSSVNSPSPEPDPGDDGLLAA